MKETPPIYLLIIYLLKPRKHPLSHTHNLYELMHVFLIMGLSCASMNLLARSPTYEPIPLVVMLHGLPCPSSELLAWTRTRIPAFPTMNSLAHSIIKLSMKWTPSLTHPNKSTFGELNRSRSACGPSNMNSSLVTHKAHLIWPMDLVRQAQHHNQSFQSQSYPHGAAKASSGETQANNLAHHSALSGAKWDQWPLPLV